MEFDEEQTRSDRSALLQQNSFYNATAHDESHHHQHPDSMQQQIAYDNPTVHHDQIEREETPQRTANPQNGSRGETSLSPPPSYDHVLNENIRLYAIRDGPATATTTLSSVSSSACPHHSPRIDSDEATQTTHLSESDSESQQYVDHQQQQQQLCSCSCPLTADPPVTPSSMPLQQQQQQQHHLHHHHHSSSATPQHFGIDPDSITLDSCESRLFSGWQNGEIEISNKSSKKLFKLMNEGVCKMSSECRCDECQSHYFDTDFDNNEHQKTDGGLGAGTPMFLNEVMHGAACTIL